MVTQVLPDAGNILDHTDPERTQLACGPDPGAHEDGRGVKCPRAEADLPPLVLLGVDGLAERSGLEAALRGLIDDEDYLAS